MKILTDKEIEDVKPIWSEEYGTARAIEAKVIDKLKSKAFRMCMTKSEDMIDDFCSELFEEKA